MNNKYNKKLTVEIELWVSHIDDIFSPPIPALALGYLNGCSWRSAVRHSNGNLEWQWCKTYEEAVEWCEKFVKKVT